MRRGLKKLIVLGIFTLMKSGWFHKANCPTTENYKFEEDYLKNKMEYIRYDTINIKNQEPPYNLCKENYLF